MNPEETALYQSLQSDPQNWDLRMSLVESLNSRGEFVESVRIICEAEVAPADEGQLRKIVSTCRDGGHLELSVPYVQAYVAAKPSSALAHYLYAKVLTKTGGDLATAREHYQTAVQMNPQLEDDVLAVKLEDLGLTKPQPLPEPVAEEPAQVEAIPAEPEPAPEPEATPTAVPAPVAVTKPTPSVAEPAAEPAAEPDPVIQSLTPPPGITTFQKLPSPAQVAATQDAPAAVEATVETASHTGRHFIVQEDGEVSKPMEKKSALSSKVSSVVIAIIAHAVVLLLLGLVVMNIPAPTPPEIVTRAAAVLDDPTMQKQEIQKIVQRKPVQSAQAQMEVMTVNGASKFAMPDIQSDLTTFDPIGMGDSFGASLSFDAGEDGGMVSFFGARSVSKRVVFAVDYSASMRSQNKDVLMRKELSKSLNSLPGGIEYQVIFFAGPAWQHGDKVTSKGNNASFLVEADRGRDKWDWVRGFRPGDAKSGALYHPEWGLEPKDLPKPEYISSTRSNIRKSIKIVEETKLVYGTDWRWPLYMAMNMEPDTIFFMTDGAFGAPNKDRMIDDIIDYSKKKGRPKINTICMMVLSAEKELTELADKTRGEFTLVLEDQTVVRGKDLADFKKNGKK